MTNDSAKLVLALKGFLKAADLTYAELAKDLKVSKPTVKRMLSGKGQISISKLNRFARF